MTFASSFGRVFSPSFQPKSQAVASSASTWWDLNGTITSCVAAYQPKGAASYAASKVNLANSGTYDAVDGAEYPTWDVSTGWDFTAIATPAHLWTGISAQNDQKMSMVCRFDNSTESDNVYIAGSYNTGGTNSGIQFSNRIGSVMRFRNGGYKDGGTKANSGVIAICGNAGYLNGSAIVTALAAWTNGVVGIEIAIGGINYRTGEGRTFYEPAAFDGRIQAFAIYSSNISSNISALTTAMNAL